MSGRGLILIICADETVGRALREKARHAGRFASIVLLPDLESGRDYMKAVAIARPAETRYVPAAVIIDETVGLDAARAHARWMRAEPTFSSVRIALAAIPDTAAHLDAAEAGVDAVIARDADAGTWAARLAGAEP